MLGWWLFGCYLSIMKENISVVKELVYTGCKFDTPYGDLCRDLKGDVNFPWGDSKSVQISYLVDIVSKNPNNPGLESAVEMMIDNLNKR